MEEKAATVWATASRAHLNRDFTFGSQALAAAFTDRESIGGRVWPKRYFPDNRFDYAFSVWGNSTLGLLLYWWHSSRQQSSKAGLTIRSAESLPILDFRKLTTMQLRKAQQIFKQFRNKELKPAYLADADPNRALLDRRVICDLLGLIGTPTSRAEARRQVVRGAVGARRQGAATGLGAGGVGGPILPPAHGEPVEPYERRSMRIGRRDY